MCRWENNVLLSFSVLVISLIQYFPILWVFQKFLHLFFLYSWMKFHYVHILPFQYLWNYRQWGLPNALTSVDRIEINMVVRINDKTESGWGINPGVLYLVDTVDLFVVFVCLLLRIALFRGTCRRLIFAAPIRLSLSSKLHHCSLTVVFLTTANTV